MFLPPSNPANPLPSSVPTKPIGQRGPFVFARPAESPPSFSAPYCDLSTLSEETSCPSHQKPEEKHENENNHQKETTKSQSKSQISVCPSSNKVNFPNNVIPAFYSITSETLAAEFPALLVIDTETTGLTGMDHVIEIGAVEVLRGEITHRRFLRTCRPEVPQNIYGGHPIFISNPINEYCRSTKVHGITNEFLRREGKPAGECIRDFKKFAEISSRASQLMMNATTPITIEAALEEAQKHELKNDDKSGNSSLPSPSLFDVVSGISQEKNVPETFEEFDLLDGLLPRGVIIPEPKLNKAVQDTRDKGSLPSVNPIVKLAAHNLAFDWRFLNAMSSRYNVPMNSIIGQKEDCLCTQRLFRLMYPGEPYSLQKVCDFLGVDRNPSEYVRHNIIGDIRNKGGNSTHSALTDAYIAAETLLKLVKIGDLAKKVGIRYKKIR
eukprot:Tbor_TRINITY_DN4557_c0_g1::TRINITY_DN4557_c0_g1_i1::g.15814::m.15814